LLESRKRVKTIEPRPSIASQRAHGCSRHKNHALRAARGGWQRKASAEHKKTKKKKKPQKKTQHTTTKKRIESAGPVWGGRRTTKLGGDRWFFADFLCFIRFGGSTKKKKTGKHPHPPRNKPPPPTSSEGFSGPWRRRCSRQKKKGLRTTERISIQFPTFDPGEEQRRKGGAN